MAKKHLLFHSAAREKVLRGATALADAVRVTLGPRSKSVLIGKRWGSFIVCNDEVKRGRVLARRDRRMRESAAGDRRWLEPRAPVATWVSRDGLRRCRGRRAGAASGPG